jgi:hypothetical protein
MREGVRTFLAIRLRGVPEGGAVHPFGVVLACVLAP